MEKSKNIIEILDNKYKGYLEDEGKWLYGGFRDVFSEGEANKENLKTPVYLMLPKEIRAYVNKILLEN